MIQSRVDFQRGDVVLVRFIFTDEIGAKRRPGVILSIEEYNQGRQEAIMAAITSNVQRLLVGDYLIEGWQEAGLLFPSVCTGIIRTIKQAMIDRKLGELPDNDLHKIQDNFRHSLGL